MFFLSCPTVVHTLKFSLITWSINYILKNKFAKSLRKCISYFCCLLYLQEDSIGLLPLLIVLRQALPINIEPQKPAV